MHKIYICLVRMTAGLRSVAPATIIRNQQQYRSLSRGPRPYKRREKDLLEYRLVLRTQYNDLLRVASRLENHFCGCLIFCANELSHTKFFHVIGLVLANIELKAKTISELFFVRTTGNTIRTSYLMKEKFTWYLVDSMRMRIPRWSIKSWIKEHPIYFQDT